MAASSPLIELIALAQEPSSTRRRELLRRVTDLFLADAHTATEAAAFDGVMCTLAADVEADVRQELAARFGSAPTAPTQLAARLARDCIQVALPILSNANLLTEADLLQVARTEGQAHLRVVSARPGLTEAVSDVIVERGDDQTLHVLVKNESAAFSRRANEAVVARAIANPDLQAVVVERASLPLDLANDMYLLVEERLRERIRARNATADPAAVEAALRAARARVASRPVAAEFTEADAEIARLHERRRLSGPVLLAFLRESRRPHFCSGLARCAEVDTATVATVVERADLDALAILCKAADFDKALFLTFAVLLCGGRDAMGRAAAYAKLYTDLPLELARRTLRFWRVRCEGEERAAA